MRYLLLALGTCTMISSTNSTWSLVLLVLFYFACLVISPRPASETTLVVAEVI